MPGTCRMILATRGSDLALAQAQEVWDALAAKYPDELELHKTIVKTSGDVLKDAALKDFGGKGAFVMEVDERVLRGEADVSVHSLKDLPTKMHPDLTLAAVLPRPAYTDALVSDFRLEELPRGAKVGTSSVRRKAMLLRARADLRVEDIRGNVPTRVRNWREGAYDGVVLSTAGLRRLRIDAPSQELDPNVFVPEPGQGAVACVCKKGSRFEEFLEGIDDATTRIEVEAEREVLRALGAGCVAPVGVHARRSGSQLTIHAIVLSLDGRRAVAVRETVSARDHLVHADEIAEKLRMMGGDTLLEEARRAAG
ncbi:MAG: hydroxymethylbilane synthase [Euryarchaeota archaeon]|nr:hydroxymethylbilane synthase [Euryarchaeota archaeon]